VIHITVNFVKTKVNVKLSLISMEPWTTYRKLYVSVSVPTGLVQVTRITLITFMLVWRYQQVLSRLLELH
jgi:hypothetical protein